VSGAGDCLRRSAGTRRVRAVVFAEILQQAQRLHAMVSILIGCPDPIVKIAQAVGFTVWPEDLDKRST